MHYFLVDLINWGKIVMSSHFRKKLMDKECSGIQRWYRKINYRLAMLIGILYSLLNNSWEDIIEL